MRLGVVRTIWLVARVALAASFLCSCSEMIGGGSYSGAAPSQSPRREVETANNVTSRFPWESWPLFVDLEGAALTDPSVVRGDEFLKQGMRPQAFDSYVSALRPGVSPILEDAVTLRVASLHLSLDRPEPALAMASQLFRKRGRAVDDVNPYFSLLLAYGYGRKGDVEQSLAWFSRVNRIVSSGAVNSSAAEGVHMLLRSVSDEQLLALGRVWSADTFVYSSIGQERKRRASGGSVRADRPGFLGDALAGGGAQGMPSVAPVAGAARLAVLLPLSGRYASLGQSTKKGVELALAAEVARGQVVVSYHDTLGDAAKASVIAREIGVTKSADLIIGPLLSEPARAVSDVARQYAIPVVALAKGSGFATGGSVFRLGLTVDNQIRTLAEYAAQVLRIRRFAVVAPKNEQGREFADTFRAEIERRGLEVVLDSRYAKEDPSALDYIAREFEAAGAQGVLIADDLPAAARLLSAIPASVRRSLKPLGIGAWDNLQQINNNRTLLEGAVYVSPFFSSSGREIVKAFGEAYRRRYSSAPDFLAAQGFDGATMVLGALRRSREESIAFDQAFREIDLYDGLTGMIAVASTGEVQRTMSVVELSGGQLRELLDRSYSVVMKGNQRFEGAGATQGYQQR